MRDIGPTRVRNYLLEESLGPSEADVRLAVCRYRRPRPSPWSRRARNDRSGRGPTAPCRVEILVPVQGWPGAGELADRVRAELSAARADGGWPEPEVDLR